jgi:5'-nucleotidase/UDP-sugar diphosphatase
VRAQEAAIGNLIADAMRAAVDADVAITNGGGIRGNKTYPAGTELKRRDILAELPFGNKTAKLELTGADIVEALEHGFSKVEEGAGRFPQVSGMTVAVDLTKPAGARVQSVKVGDVNLDPSATYTVATNDFMARGGDGYAAFVGARNLIDPAAAQLMASQVIDHVAAAGTVSPAVEVGPGPPRVVASRRGPRITREGSRWRRWSTSGRSTSGWPGWRRPGPGARAWCRAWRR